MYRICQWWKIESDMSLILTHPKTKKHHQKLCQKSIEIPKLKFKLKCVHVLKIFILLLMYAFDVCVDRIEMYTLIFCVHSDNTL